MLRRKPTAITLTSEDVASFEDYRTAAQNKENKPDANTGITSSSTAAKEGIIDPNDELRPLPGDKARIVRSGLGRDERIGVTGRIVVFSGLGQGVIGG
ncbi:MAG: hypothetical protein M1830_005176 [Pleopsidium flavum]|nr:MAG: hypothetical protein M1830_005176 [Pleopsidium flavum]